MFYDRQEGKKELKRQRGNSTGSTGKEGKKLETGEESGRG